MIKINKSFSDNLVLNDIDFSSDKGQVHALIGENGAGKSTLMKVLAGLYAPDSGEIWIDGKSVAFQNPKEAQEIGIAMIYQETRLFEDLNIIENVFIRREPIKNIKWVRLIDWDKAFKDTKKYLDYLGLDINPKTPLKKLSMGQKKFVEIIRALSMNAKIMILDEPTAALTDYEIETLFQAIRDVKKLGVTVIYISHRLEEIKKIADKVTVIRDGKLIQTSSIDEVDINRIVKVMVGEEIEDRYPKLKVSIGKEVLRVEDLAFDRRIRDVNFSIKKGEIVGLTGLSGSGRHLLAKLLIGVKSPYEGMIHINGKAFKSMDPYKAKSNGLCYVTGIGTEEGLITDTSIMENISISNLQRVSNAGFINDDTETTSSKNFIDRLEIMANEREVVYNLSGGKQKRSCLRSGFLPMQKYLL